MGNASRYFGLFQGTLNAGNAPDTGNNRFCQLVILLIKVKEIQISQFKSGVLVLAVTSLLAGLVSGCGGKNETSETQPPPPPRDPVDMTVRQSRTLQQDENGQPLWEIEASQVNLEESTATLTVEKGKIVVYDDGQEAIRLDFPRLSADAGEKRITAEGGVVVQSTEGNTRFRAGQCVIDLNRDSIQATAGVEGRNEDGSFRSETLSSDLKFTRITLSGSTGVEAVIGSPELFKP